MPAEAGARQGNEPGIAPLRSQIKASATWVAHAEDCSRLVKCLARSVVDGRTEQHGFERALHREEARMSTGNHESKGGPCNRWAIEQAGHEMSGNMIHADKWAPAGPRDGLCSTRADEERPDQSWSRSTGDTRDGAKRHARFAERSANDGHDALQMRAAGNLRDDAAVLLMQCVLACGRAGADSKGIASDLDDRSRCFVATALDAQDLHGRRA